MNSNYTVPPPPPPPPPLQTDRAEEGGCGRCGADEGDGQEDRGGGGEQEGPRDTQVSGEGGGS